MNSTKFETCLTQFSASRNALGCTGSEILELERKLETQFPEDYRHFLKTCGHRVDDFMRGSTFGYCKLLDLQESAAQLIEESNATTMPEGSVVIMMHQGYQFYFLNDTGVYYYMEGNSEYEKRFDNFGEFFRTVVSKEGGTGGA